MRDTSTSLIGAWAATWAVASWRGAWSVFQKYVVSGFSRTVSGPPEGGHYVQMKIAVVERGGDEGRSSLSGDDELVLDAKHSVHLAGPQPRDGLV